jgi:hypothetical protein
VIRRPLRASRQSKREEESKHAVSALSSASLPFPYLFLGYFRGPCVGVFICKYTSATMQRHSCACLCVCVCVNGHIRVSLLHENTSSKTFPGRSGIQAERKPKKAWCAAPPHLLSVIASCLFFFYLCSSSVLLRRAGRFFGIEATP